MATLDGEGREGQRDQGPLCHRCLVYHSCRLVWSADPAAGDEILDYSGLLNVRLCWRFKCHLIATHSCLHWPPSLPFKRTIWNPNICTLVCACKAMNWLPKAKRWSALSSPSICNLKILVQKLWHTEMFCLRIHSANGLWSFPPAKLVTEWWIWPTSQANGCHQRRFRFSVALISAGRNLFGVTLLSKDFGIDTWPRETWAKAISGCASWLVRDIGVLCLVEVLLWFM